MTLKHVVTAALIAVTLTEPAFAGAILPHLRPPAAVFRKLAARDRPSACNNYAGFGATVAETVQNTIIDPLMAVAGTFTGLFHPFLTEALSEDQHRYSTTVGKRTRLKSPSSLVREAGQRRLCG